MAIGSGAGSDTQGTASIAIGVSSGATRQGNSAIAIGNYAGVTDQGANSIAIGFNAGMTSQAASSIIISTNVIPVTNTVSSSCVIWPIRNDNAQTAATRMHWNASTFEVSYGNESSAARYKTNVQLLEDDYAAKFVRLIPKRFVYIANNVKGVGFIAEEVEEAGLSEFVSRDPVSGEITGLVYEHMVAPLLKLVQKHEATIENLTTRIDTYETMIQNLTYRMEKLENPM